MLARATRAAAVVLPILTIAVAIVTAEPAAAAQVGLAATGQTIPLWIPIVGGLLLLGGIAAVVVSALRKRGGKQNPPT